MQGLDLGIPDSMFLVSGWLCDGQWDEMPGSSRFKEGAFAPSVQGLT